MTTEEIIIKEIKKIGSDVAYIPNTVCHFIYRRRNFIFIPSENSDYIRLCVPGVKPAEHNTMQVINNANRKLRFVKIMLSEEGSTIINYDMRTSDNMIIKDTLLHMLKILSMAADYIEKI